MTHNSKTLYIPSSMRCMTYYIGSPFISPPCFFITPQEKKASLFQVFSTHQSSIMVPELEKPRVTEIKVRMDCNGCVQKIKKALNGITGIYDLYVDFPQQKITVIGWADPEKIVKAIKKTRKSAVICSHTEQSDQPPQQTSDPPPESGDTANEGGAPPPESNNPPTEQHHHHQTEAPPSPPEAQKDSSPPSQPPPNNQPTDANPSSESSNDTTSQPSKPKDVEQIHVVYHHPPDYSHRYAYGGYFQQGFRGDPQPQPQPPQPIYVNHSYNTYKPSPYVTEYAYPQSQPEYSHYSRPEQYSQVYQSQPEYSHYSRSEQYSQVYQSQPMYSHYSRPDHYSPVYYSANNNNNGNGNGNGNGNITSMFSEENPNACSIV